MESTSAHSLPRAEGAWQALVALAVLAATIDIVNLRVSLWVGVPTTASLVPSLVFWVTYLPSLYAIFIFAGRCRLNLVRDKRTLAIHMAAALAFSYIHTTIYAFVSYGWPISGSDSLQAFVRGIRINFPVDFVSYWGVIGIAYAFHYYSESHRRVLVETQLRNTSEQMQVRLTEARLRSLRSQLNPHFLLNTLNAVSALAITGDAQSVSRMLSRLGVLLRQFLEDDAPQLVRLSRDLEFLDSYLELQQLVVGDRLDTRRQIAPDALDALVPGLILQPLVENAILHGVTRQPGPGCVVLDVAREGNTLRLTVHDSGPGFSSDVPSRTGIGLSNTEARLKQLFGDHYRIEYARSELGGAAVTLRIPFVVDVAGARERRPA